MSDKRKERELVSWLKEWREGCKDVGIKCAYCDATKSVDCYEAYKQIYQAIQQTPEIDEKYVEEKMKEILEHDKKDDTPLYVAKNIVTQIISDMRGR